MVTFCRLARVKFRVSTSLYTKSAGTLIVVYPVGDSNTFMILSAPYKRTISAYL